MINVRLHLVIKIRKASYYETQGIRSPADATGRNRREIGIGRKKKCWLRNIKEWTTKESATLMLQRTRKIMP